MRHACRSLRYRHRQKQYPQFLLRNEVRSGRLITMCVHSRHRTIPAHAGVVPVVNCDFSRRRALNHQLKLLNRCPPAIRGRKDEVNPTRIAVSHVIDLGDYLSPLLTKDRYTHPSPDLDDDRRRRQPGRFASPRHPSSRTRIGEYSCRIREHLVGRERLLPVVSLPHLPHRKTSNPGTHLDHHSHQKNLWR